MNKSLRTDSESFVIERPMGNTLLKRTALVVAVLSLAVGSFVQARADTPIFVELNSPEPTAVARYEAQKAGKNFDANLHRAAIRQAQDELLGQLSAAGVLYTLTSTSVLVGGSPTDVPNRYSELINAVRLAVPGTAVRIVRQNPRVKHISVDVPRQLHLDRSVPYIRANGPDSARSRGLRGTGQVLTDGSSVGQVVAVLDTGIDHTNPMFDSRFDDSQFEMRSDDIRPVRLQGSPYMAGVNHPKVAYRFLFSTAPFEGDDTGHGTSVASTAAGLKARADTTLNNGEILEGVAPGAVLMDYKVCPSLICTTEQILLALDDVARETDFLGFPKPRATVVNMSFGDDAGDPESADAVAAGNLQFLGVLPEASAGNDGPGENTIGSPSSGRLVLATAACLDPGVSPNSVDVLQQNQTVHDNPGPAANPTTLPVEPDTPTILAFFAPESNGGLGFTEALAQYYVDCALGDTPEQVPVSVSGRLCLCERGSTVNLGVSGSGLFANKAAQCAAKGGIGLVVFNSAPGQIGVVLAPSSIPVFTISREDGLFLRDSLGFESGEFGALSQFPLRLNPADPTLFVADTAGFSSRGPNNDFKVVKPDITAPGVEILMAASKIGVLGNPLGFTIASGTSFSGPHISGAAALVRDALARPDFTPSMVRAALMNGSTNLREADGTPIPNTDPNNFVHEAGAGLVEMVRAISVKALMGTNDRNGGGGPDDMRNPDFLPSHSFGERPWIGTGLDAGQPFQKAKITVTMADVGGSKGSYSLSVVDAGEFRGDVTRPLTQTGFMLSLSRTSVSVPRNGTGVFDVMVAVDGRSGGLQLAGTDITGAQATEFLWYVVATRSDGSESLRMPFYLRVVQGVPGGGVVGTVTGGGWISNGTNGKSNFGFNAHGSSPVQGHIQFDDSQQGIGLKGDVAAVSISNDGFSATFSGPCTLKNGSPCQYTCNVQDNAEPGKGADHFSITVTGGAGYQASGLLGGGNIQIHRRN